MPFDLNGNLITENEMFDKSVTDPIPCVLLNPELSLEEINAFEKEFYVLDVEYEGKMCKGIALTYFRANQKLNKGEKYHAK